jgi:hypothetical protein
MKFSSIVSAIASVHLCSGKRVDRQLLSHAPVPVGTYAPVKNVSVTTLLDFLQSRGELSVLAGMLGQLSGEITSTSSSRLIRG